MKHPEGFNLWHEKLKFLHILIMWQGSSFMVSMCILFSGHAGCELPGIYTTHRGGTTVRQIWTERAKTVSRSSKKLQRSNRVQSDLVYFYKRNPDVNGMNRCLHPWWRWIWLSLALLRTWRFCFRVISLVIQRTCFIYLFAIRSLK